MIPEAFQMLNNHSGEQDIDYFDDTLLFDVSTQSIAKLQRTVDDDYSDLNIGWNENVTSVVSKGFYYYFGLAECSKLQPETLKLLDITVPCIS